MKVLITGGHITPALAVVDELKDCDVVIVGRQHALSADRSDSLEYKEVIRKNLRFINLNAGRLTRVLSFSSFVNAAKIPLGLVSAMLILKKERPDVVLTFGGYIALPVALAASILKIPIITHEQTIRPGSANSFIARLAKKIMISFPASSHYFPSGKTVLSGNPVRKEVLKVVDKIKNFKKNKPVVYITGGSTGSHDLNSLIFKILPELLKKYTVIHQTGSSTEFRDFDKTAMYKNDNYFPFTHIESNLIGYVYLQSDLVISRGGANTVFELLATKKPSIIIPLPWSAFDEQQKHAEYLRSLGVAEIFDQSRPSEELLSAVESILASLEKYRKNFDTIDQPYESQNPAKQIAKEVMEAAKNSTGS